MAKVHAHDIRLFNNAGMDFPLCASSAPLLDCDKGRWETTGILAKVTCKKCLKLFPKRYPWAKGY